MAARKKNYLNNGDLIKNIRIAKENQVDHPEWTPAQCMPPELVKMCSLLVEKFAQKKNFRNYTYIEDWKSEAILALLQNGLKFNEEKSNNAFGYYTQIVNHVFLTQLEKEEKMRNIRDDLIEQQNNPKHLPSHTRQLQNEESGVKSRLKLEHIFYGEDIPPEPDPKRFSRRWKKKKVDVKAAPAPKTTTKKATTAKKVTKKKTARKKTTGTK